MIKLLKRTGSFVRYFANGTGKSNENGSKKEWMSTEDLPSGSLIRLLYQKVRNVAHFRKYKLDARFLDGKPGELRFIVPAVQLEEAQITMMVDEKNRFSLISYPNKELYKKEIDLPRNGNFEKAIFKANLERGLVRVSVTNFERCEVVVSVD